MEELDFTRPADDGASEAETVRRSFEAAAAREKVTKGEYLFRENQASDRLYLLVDGEVGLVRGGKSLDIVKAGEMFGEIAAITGQPRTASAVARADCEVWTLDPGQFQRALQSRPEFALALLKVMANRLRLAAAMLRVRSKLPDTARSQSGSFDRTVLEWLKGALPGHLPQRSPAHSVIVREGEIGNLMYVVLYGWVDVSIHGKVLERIGPGGVFGEMALVDQSPRAASAIAESEASLMAISRSDFMSLVKAKPVFGIALLKAAAERLRYLTVGGPG